MRVRAEVTGLGFIVPVYVWGSVCRYMFGVHCAGMCLGFSGGMYMFEGQMGGGYMFGWSDGGRYV